MGEPAVKRKKFIDIDLIDSKTHKDSLKRFDDFQRQNDDLRGQFYEVTKLAKN